MNEFDYIDAIRTLINVSAVTSIVDYIRPFENIASDYINKKKFIVISRIEGVLNINIYVPDISSNADVTSLKAISNAVLPLVNATEGAMAFYSEGIADAARADVDGYHFINIVLGVVSFDKNISVYGLENTPDPDGYGNGTVSNVLKFSVKANMAFSQSQSLVMQGMAIENSTYLIQTDYSANVINKSDLVVIDGITYLAANYSQADANNRFFTTQIILQRA